MAQKVYIHTWTYLQQIMTIWKKLSVVKCEMEQLVGFVEAASLAGEL